MVFFKGIKFISQHIVQSFLIWTTSCRKRALHVVQAIDYGVDIKALLLVYRVHYALSVGRLLCRKLRPSLISTATDENFFV